MEESFYVKTFAVVSQDTEKTNKNRENELNSSLEFDVHFLELDKSNVHNDFSVYKKLIEAVKIAVNDKEDVILFCKNGISVLDRLNTEFLFYNLIDASEKGLDFLIFSGETNDMVAQLSPNLYYINSFTNSDCFVIYSTAFDFILNTQIVAEHSSFMLDTFLSRILFCKGLLYDKSLELSQKIEGKIKTLKFPNQEQRIKIVVPFFNVENFIDKCCKSILSQEYKNYQVFFLDDMSTDKSIIKISNDPRFCIIQNREKKFALQSIHDTLQTKGIFEPDDIVVILDGDDFLLHRFALLQLDVIYKTQQCLISYGQYITNTGKPGHCYAYKDKEEFENLRNLPWRASHLKSFKYKVYNELLKQDPFVQSFKDNNGDFFKMTYDIALMFPLLEIAGFENIFFNNYLMYVYRLHSMNEAYIDASQQRIVENKIRQKQKFQQVF